MILLFGILLQKKKLTNNTNNQNKKQKSLKMHWNKKSHIKTLIPH